MPEATREAIMVKRPPLRQLLESMHGTKVSGEVTVGDVKASGSYEGVPESLARSIPDSANTGGLGKPSKGGS